MKKRIIKSKKVIFGSGCVAMAGILAFCLIFSMSVNIILAYTSLPHITEIVDSISGTGKSFNILEINDSTDDGIGFYIAGQEPTAGWRSELAKLPTKQARVDYMSNMLAKLNTKGIIWADNSRLLTKKDYTEVYPWESVGMGMSPLKLTQKDTLQVAGNVNTGVKGPYMAAYRYEIATPGQYVQKIERLVHSGTTEGATAQYFYTPVFKQINEEGKEPVELEKGMQIYEKRAGDIYEYLGTIGQGLELNMENPFKR